MRNLLYKLKSGFLRFMSGRYGTDQLNNVILWTGVGLCVLSMLIPVQWLSLLVTMLAYVCMGVAIFRTLSKNTYKRYLENRRYLQLVQQLKDRDHRYFKCPKCRQSVRVPKSKGKISISCPKCKERFIRKS